MHEDYEVEISYGTGSSQSVELIEPSPQTNPDEFEGLRELARRLTEAPRVERDSPYPGAGPSTAAS